ncbi:hypothetical protein NKG05_26535 [Oerskovia sp. M15]
MPLAHVFARFIGVLVVAGGTVLGHTPDTKTLLEDLGEFRPTYILSVPRVFEKVYNSSEQKAAAGGKVKIFHWAAATAIAWSRAQDEPKGPGIGLALQHKVADVLVYKKLRAALGGQTSGPSPAARPRRAPGPLLPGHRRAHPRGLRPDRDHRADLGEPPDRDQDRNRRSSAPGLRARIAEDGEILLKGHHVFRGYHNNPQATQDAFVGGWFRTGDLGSFDTDGFLRITGRKKEIIVTAGGKNVAPAVLEDRIRAHALVSQCVVVGDGQPFIGALMTLDPEGLPGWLAMHGKEP